MHGIIEEKKLKINIYFFLARMFMHKKSFFYKKNSFAQGFVIGFSFCGAVAFILLLILWIFV